MHWNLRLCKRKGAGGFDFFAIHEVYYKDGTDEIQFYSENPASMMLNDTEFKESTIDALNLLIVRMRVAVTQKEVIDLDELDKQFALRAEEANLLGSGGDSNPAVG